MRLALRCDGNETIGAGHVARCLPLATAFAQRGWTPVFVGRYTGLAQWLIERAGIGSEAPVDVLPSGVDPQRWAAAIVDDYHIRSSAICALAAELPVATMAEARRCPGSGIVVDYHLDRAGEPVTKGELPGPRFAPLDPGLLGARRTRAEVGRVLIVVGGGVVGRPLVIAIVNEVRQVFPGARIVVGSGVSIEGVDELPFPSGLQDAIATCDVAVSAAGFTAYELACAGVPAVLVEIAPNQRRVARASAAAGTALSIEAKGRWRPALARVLRRLGEREVRDSLTAAGTSAFDGVGAARGAAALERRWRGDPPSALILRAAGQTDAARLLAWRNDPSANRWFSSSTRVSTDQHVAWLEQTLADPNRILLIIEGDEQPLGQVRLDLDGPSATVSITVDAGTRGRGVGRAALDETTRLAGQLGLERLEARIKPGNAASLAAFAAAGFAAWASDRSSGETLLHWVDERRHDHGIRSTLSDPAGGRGR